MRLDKTEHVFSKANSNLGFTQFCFDILSKPSTESLSCFGMPVFCSTPVILNNRPRISYMMPSSFLSQMIWDFDSAQRPRLLRQCKLLERMIWIECFPSTKFLHTTVTKFPFLFWLPLLKWGQLGARSFPFNAKSRGNKKVDFMRWLEVPIPTSLIDILHWKRKISL